MKVLIVGASGQLGRELQRTRPGPVELVPANRDALDITDQEAAFALVEAHAPEVLINCAAYTAVDGAETKPDIAVEVNGTGAGTLAKAAARTGARMIQISTDFVFDGESRTPYSPRHEPRPLGVYGHSKLAGERRVQELLPLDSVIVRTAWLYSSFGANFVKTMLRLMSERDELRVVCDQTGSPTWARGLAEALWRLLEHPATHGIHHWTDRGSCSWYDFACAIMEQGLALGLLERPLSIEPVPTSEYPTPAKRPPYSVLDCSATRELLDVPGADWRDQLNAMLEELASP